MMRKRIPKETETAVLTMSGRRCCFCFFLSEMTSQKQGQIAHVNRDPGDFAFDNLAFLCLDHHDAYDSATSQSKGYTTQELKHYRDLLYKKRAVHVKRALGKQPDPELPPVKRSSEASIFKGKWTQKFDFVNAPWEFRWWQVADQPELFAYKAMNRSDGVCLVERINLPDGRIVVACISLAGNPGCSISNAVEELCFQICTRFRLPPKGLVWLLHYDEENYGWTKVQFEGRGAYGPFTNPTFLDMTEHDWVGLRLHPKKVLAQSNGHWESKLTKLFPWPPAEYAL